jgi:hypothetical protein
MEKINAVRVTKYGVQLSDGSYRYTTDAVMKFLEGKLPAELDVLSMMGKKIAGVAIRKPISSQINKGKTEDRSISEMSKLKNMVNARIAAITNATNLVIADPDSKKNKDVVLTYAAEFLAFIEGMKVEQKKEVVQVPQKLLKEEFEEQEPDFDENEEEYQEETGY